jgi:hypothetical protein
MKMILIGAIAVALGVILASYAQKMLNKPSTP